MVSNDPCETLIWASNSSEPLGERGETHSDIVPPQNNVHARCAGVFLQIE